MSALENEKDRLLAELAAVEQQWLADQNHFMARDAEGNLLPKKPVSVSLCIKMMVGSVVAMAILSATSLPSFFTLIGLIPFGWGTFQLMIGSSKAEAFERCRTEYETRRGSILRKLDAHQ